MTSKDPRGGVVAVVLAAGASRRFRAESGRHKLLAELDGRPVVNWALEGACASFVDQVLVVVDPDDEVGDAVRKWASARSRHDGRLPPVTVVDNPRAGEGQATSVVSGLLAATATPAMVAVILLADEPQVSAEAIDLVAAAVEPAGQPLAVRARYHQETGHPVAFARPLWPMLTQRLEGDRGARAVFDHIAIAEVDVPGQRPIDIDALADLHGARQVAEASDTTIGPGDR